MAVEAPHVEVPADPALVQLDDLDHGPATPNAIDAARHLEADGVVVGHEVRARSALRSSSTSGTRISGALPSNGGRLFPSISLS
jgi:hypothetical protein